MKVPTQQLRIQIWTDLDATSNGHGWMFLFGIFFPFVWLIEAFMQPIPQAA